MHEPRSGSRRRDERGASAVEYGLLIAGIAAMIVVAVFAFGGGATRPVPRQLLGHHRGPVARRLSLISAAHRPLRPSEPWLRGVTCISRSGRRTARRGRSAAASSGGCRTRTATRRTAWGRPATAAPAAFCTSANASGSWVARSESTSARVSIRRLMPFCTGLASSVAIATQRQHPGHHAAGRPATPLSPDQQPQQTDAEQGTGRAEQRAGEHVVVARMSQLVGDDGEDLAVVDVVDEVVVDDDPARRPEAGHVGVQRGRASRRVGHQHVVHLHALLRRPARGSGCGAGRPAAVRSG